MIKAIPGILLALIAIATVGCSQPATTVAAPKQRSLPPQIDLEAKERATNK